MPAARAAEDFQVGSANQIVEVSGAGGKKKVLRGPSGVFRVVPVPPFGDRRTQSAENSQSAADFRPAGGRHGLDD